MKPMFAPETALLAAVAAVAAQVGPISDDLNLRYAAGDPLAVRELQSRGLRILPGIRMQEAAELARWAAFGTPAELLTYIATAWDEGRVNPLARWPEIATGPA